MDLVKEATETLLDGLQKGDATVIGILVAIVVVILTVLILACSGGANKRRGVLLLGVSDAGKTLLFNQLVNRKFVETYTSMKVNTGTYESKQKAGRRLEVIDIPGNERLRAKCLDQYKAQARAVIYVIDSSSIQKELKDVAEFLYMTMTDRVVSHNAPPILVACNKQDKIISKGFKVIQDMLEKEMNTVRKTKSAALLTTDETANNNTFLGKPNQPFSFSDVRLYKVQFVECSASEASISDIEDWLQKLV